VDNFPWTDPRGCYGKLEKLMARDLQRFKAEGRTLQKPLVAGLNQQELEKRGMFRTCIE